MVGMISTDIYLHKKDIKCSDAYLSLIIEHDCFVCIVYFHTKIMCFIHQQSCIVFLKEEQQTNSSGDSNLIAVAIKSYLSEWTFIQVYHFIVQGKQRTIKIGRKKNEFALDEKLWVCFKHN